MTWNPVWGCLNNCEYCYARKISKRFSENMAFWEMKYKNKNYFMGNNIDEYWELKSHLEDFKPIFLQRQFDKKFPKKSQRIFVGSMSEIYYWEDEWIEKVIEKIEQFPQHIFIFLSKYMEVYAKWMWPENCILGVTITKQKDFDKQRGGYYFFNKRNKILLCLEPLLGQINIENFNTKYLRNYKIDWVIIGAETGNRKGKVIPKIEWIEDIIRYCVVKDIPIYLKDSLKELYPGIKHLKEFPNYK